MGLAILRRSRVIVLALLCMIALHAIPAGALPSHVESGGSAFSPSTSEVSLAMREQAGIGLKALPTPIPPLVPDDEPVALPLQVPAASWPGKRQTAPPVPWPLPPATSPRAPPFLS